MTHEPAQRPVALVTGVGRTVGLGAAIATRLAADGWDVATAHWAPYDERMPWGHPAGDVEQIAQEIREAGGRTVAVKAVQDGRAGVASCTHHGIGGTTNRTVLRNVTSVSRSCGRTRR